MSTLQNTSRLNASRRINWRILLLTLGMFALGTDAFVVAGVLPVIARQMRVTEGLAGQLVTIFSLAYGLGAPILAAITSRWPRNQVLLAALGAFCLVNVGSALSPTFPLLLITRLLAGCSAATFAPLAFTIGTTLASDEKRGQALALVVLGHTTATVLGSPLGTWVGVHLDWRFSFGLVALLAGIAFLALLLSGLPKAPNTPVLSLSARLAPMREPRLLLALLPALLWNLGIYAVYTYLAPLLHRALSIGDISGLLLIFGIGIVVGNVGGGVIADRLGAARSLVIGLIILTLVYATLDFSFKTVVGTVLALFIWGVMGALAFILQQYRLLNLAPQHANVILALNNSTLYLGVAGGAALGGVVLQSGLVTSLGWVGAACVLLALPVLWLSLRAHSLPNASETALSSSPSQQHLVTPE